MRINRCKLHRFLQRAVVVRKAASTPRPANLAIKRSVDRLNQSPISAIDPDRDRRDDTGGADHAVSMLAGAVPEIDGFVMPGPSAGCLCRECEDIRLRHRSQVE